MKEKCKKIIKRVISTLYIFFVILIFLAVISTAQGKRPSIFGYEFLRVLTSSMQPTIAENECIIIKEVNKENIKAGDIITFVSEDEQIYGMYNTHRVVKVEEIDGETWYTTKGDANSDNDTLRTKYANVVGKYERKAFLGDVIGNGIAALTDNKVYFVVVMLPLMICMMSYVIDIYKVLTGDDEGEEAE